MQMLSIILTFCKIDCILDSSVIKYDYKRSKGSKSLQRPLLFSGAIPSSQKAARAGQGDLAVWK